MSNFIAPTRKKGTNDEWKDATWIDGYFGGRKYGVRLEGTDEWLDGSEYEIEEVIAK